MTTPTPKNPHAVVHDPDCKGMHDLGRCVVKLPAAVELGRLGGKVSSPAKTRASRENAKRPRLTRACIGCKCHRVVYNQGSDYCDVCTTQDIYQSTHREAAEILAGLRFQEPWT